MSMNIWRRGVIAGSGDVASFDPTSIAGIAYWFKPGVALYTDTNRDTLVTTDGAVVGSWTDSSGFNQHAGQPPTSTLRPILKKAIQNGLDVIRFDGATPGGDFLFTATHTWGSVFTVFAVAKLLNTTVPAGVCNSDDGGGANRIFQFRYESTISMNLLSIPGVNSDAEAVISGQFNVLTGWRQATTITTLVNGTGTGGAAGAIAAGKLFRFEIGAGLLLLVIVLATWILVK